jgi:predicted permease
MSDLIQDTRIALRTLLKRPGFAAVVVLSLALGIGGNTAIFSLLNSVFLQPLPIDGPDEIVLLFGTDERNTGRLLDYMPVSIPNFRDYRDQNQVFAGLATAVFSPVSLAGEERPEEVPGLLVTGNYFEVLGVRARYGRTIFPEDDRVEGGSPVVVLSHRLWQRRFGGEPSVVGRGVKLNGGDFTIIGVTAAGFRGTNAIGGPELWIPLSMYGQVLSGFTREHLESRRALLSFPIARLRPGVVAAQAEASLKPLATELAARYPSDNFKRGITVTPLREATVPPAFREAMLKGGLLLMAAAGLVLLIACANVANLMLARATSRLREMAVRASLGAGRLRLVRQLLVESLLIAAVSGAAGVLLALWLQELLLWFKPPFLPEGAIDFGLSPPVLLFSCALALFSTLLFGLVPALYGTRIDLATALKTRGEHQTAGAGRFGLRNILVTAQVALSVVALAGAGLFIRSLSNAQRIDPGFETEKLALATVRLTEQQYSPAKARQFHEQALAEIRAIPGVAAAGLSSVGPFQGGFMRSIFAEGRDEVGDESGILVHTPSVDSQFLAAAGIGLLQGRLLTEADREGSQPVAVINEAMARRVWPGEDAVGKGFRFHGETERTVVAGVVRTATQFLLGEDPQPVAYLPMAQHHADTATFYVRTLGEPRGVLEAMRARMQALDPILPVQNVQTIIEVLGQALWAPRLGAILLGAFGALSLLLAALGVYGVLDYSVGQRRREIGVRIALGASRGDVLQMVMRYGAALAVVGLAIGIAGSLAATRYVSSLLFDMQGVDWLTLGAVSAVLLAIALLATWLPASRAAETDPLVTLREE